MDVSDDFDNKPSESETTQDQEAESMAVDDLVREIANVDPAAEEDFADHDKEDRENSEKLDVVVGSDAVAETLDSFTKPPLAVAVDVEVEESLSLSEELTLTQAAAASTDDQQLVEETERTSLGTEANGVSDQGIDSISKEETTDSASASSGGHNGNGYSDPTPKSQAPEGTTTDPALDEETNGVSTSKETTLLDSVVSNVSTKSVDVGESDHGPQVPHSTENLGYVAVTPLSLQRTSWRDCCGLFHILRRRSDQ